MFTLGGSAVSLTKLLLAPKPQKNQSRWRIIHNVPDSNRVAKKKPGNFPVNRENTFTNS